MSVPEEVVDQLKLFHEKLTRIEDSLENYFELDSENLELLETLDRARVGLMTLYSANSLYWIYLCTKGQRPTENESMKTELERIKEYMSRLKTIEEKVKAPKLNPKAAKAFVRNALFDPSQDTPDADQLTLPNSKKRPVKKSNAEEIPEMSEVSEGRKSRKRRR